MAILNLVLAPDPIYKLKSDTVSQVNDEVRRLMDDILETIYSEHGIGIAAPMVGVSKRVVVIDMQEDGKTFANFHGESRNYSCFC